MNISSLILHREKLIFYLVLIVFISFPISYAINNISMVGLLVVFFMDKKENIKSKLKGVLKDKLVKFYVLFFCMQLLGLFYTENLEFGLTRVEKYLPFLFLPAVLSQEKFNKEKFNKLMNIVKYGITIIFLYYLFVHTIIDGRELNTFVHFTLNVKMKISQFYLAFIIMIPFLQSMYQVKNNNNKYINFLILLISIFLLVILGNVTTLLFLTLYFFYLLLKKTKITYKKFATGIFLVVFLGVLMYQIPMVNNKFQLLYKTTDFNLKTIKTKNKFTHTKNTFEHRVLINIYAFQLIKENFPFGVGTGDFFQELVNKYKINNFKVGFEDRLNNHNQYLEEFLKTGIFGGFAFIYLLFILFKSSIKNKDFALPVTLFFMLVCMVESLLFRQHGVLIFSFFIPFFIKNPN